MWQWRKRFLLCVPRSIFGKGVAVAIAPKPCGFSNALEKGIPLWKATNFHRSGRRSQAGKWRMGEIRPVSAGKRKGPLLSSVLVLSRISAPISTHPTPTELLDDAVVRDGLADHSVCSRPCWERMLVG